MVPIEPVVAGIAAVVASIASIAAAGVAGKWVWGREFRAMERDRNLWRDGFLRMIGHTEATAADALAVARHATALAERAEHG